MFPRRPKPTDKLSSSRRRFADSNDGDGNHLESLVLEYEVNIRRKKYNLMGELFCIHASWKYVEKMWNFEKKLLCGGIKSPIERAFYLRSPK